MPPTAPQPFAEALAARGLNLVGCLDPATARTAVLSAPDPKAPPPALPDPGTVLVCGSGGRGHWESLTPADLDRPHPIADSAQRTIETALPLLGAESRLVTVAEIARFDLRALAELVGWGYVSPHLLLLIHPTYGPWVSVRTLVFTSAVLPRSAPLSDYDPCGPCARPCLDTCPAGAYRRDHPWSFARCGEHRLRGRAPERHCDDSCHARQACPVGREHAYGIEEYRHRHRAHIDDVRRYLLGE